MKTLSILFTTLLLSSHAFAGTYSVYVSNAVQVSQAQAELVTLTQKNILLNPAQKALRIQLSRLCGPHAMCSEQLQNFDFKLDALKANRSAPIYARATGMLYFKGQPAPTTIEITLNPNNSTQIVIASSVGCKTMISRFIGSPATPSTLLYHLR